MTFSAGTLFFIMSGEKCTYTKINENGKRLQCRKKAVTLSGTCALHDDGSNDSGVTVETELGLAAYDSLADIEMDIDNNKEKEELTTVTPRKEVFVPQPS